MADADKHALLVQVLDEILPEHNDLPAASGVGLAELLAARSKGSVELTSALDEVLKAVALQLTQRGAADLRGLDPNARVAVLQSVEAERPNAFIRFTRHAHMDYYLHPTIPPKVGMPPRPPQPLGHEMPKNVDLDALLAPVRARGKVWRDA